MKNYFKSLSAEQPDVRFFGLRLVKFVSVIFGSVFLFTLFVTLFDTSTLNLKLDVEGLKFFFLDAMKVPGSILAFYLAVLGLIGANHRSEQTKKQISVTGEQNRFSNYFKHLEEFKKHVEGLEEKHQIDMSKIRMVHDNLFSQAYEYGDYNISSNALEVVFVALSRANECMKVAKTDSCFVNLPNELSYLYPCQSMFGIKGVIRHDLADSSLSSSEHRINLNKEFILDLAEFAKILRFIIAFSNSTVWDSRLSALARNIRLNYEEVERKIARQSELEAREKDISDMLRDAGVE
ncbi:hypothetical protein [Vibrio parahaemolyticus]|uniref:hypothetical protein n=1 Tax=Vibrio parahaemolyticus TaxID=670 RepID=UPI00111DD5F7|nr:hypothetical protein [Vibrio parahaemolyticus]TOL25180.1 hypothetical protein CGI02_13365 [Vibrio parahaemolyticus]